MPKKHIVFIHGFLENAGMWKSFTSQLSKSNMTYTPELAGHGQRPTLKGAHSIEAFADDILSQLKATSAQKFVIVGHSMGGYTAIELCKLFPERVSALCLFHSTARADSEQKKLDRNRAIEAVKQNQPLYTRTMISGLFHEPKKDYLLPLIEQQIADANTMTTAAITTSLEAMRDRVDNTAWLAQRSFPLYYFLGDDDPRLPMTDMQKELAQLPGSVVEIVEHTGHMGHMECPAQAFNFIQRIIRADM